MSNDKYRPEEMAAFFNKRAAGYEAHMKGLDNAEEFYRAIPSAFVPIAPGEELFWDDPHISKCMLESHLNSNIDGASRKPEMIEKSVNNLIHSMNIKPGDKILDLGCGPGLYCRYFAQLGFKVTSLDYSRRSIMYAVQDASRSAP